MSEITFGVSIGPISVDFSDPPTICASIPPAHVCYTLAPTPPPPVIVQPPPNMNIPYLPPPPSVQGMGFGNMKFR